MSCAALVHICVVLPFLCRVVIEVLENELENSRATPWWQKNQKLPNSLTILRSHGDLLKIEYLNLGVLLCFGEFFEDRFNFEKQHGGIENFGKSNIWVNQKAINNR